MESSREYNVLSIVSNNITLVYFHHDIDQLSRAITTIIEFSFKY
ncbi:Putative uncharacterized protein [Moritella viscosa]|uniref:Uncharacterized protein n=1 Tax=Moritella viscosa TaxID=80854 RepID=A0A1L0EV09_9GAMM|nr:Putative uncharacterized protein [Moritella viscosa]SGZ04572.1 Putative uncharacterized protein [Moritella viscosa]SGZ04980.1 Putative uncharacterized protein [Moritella viscosa]SGZ11565.1 Putative uncharacterized protein [Moritella viscosa]SGZ11708.1 Putative uncharacterized protein [Moritella viscosa]